MDGHNQDRRCSQNTVSSSQESIYSAVGSASSQNELLSGVAAGRYRHGQQQQQPLGLTAQARTLESSTGGDSQYYSDPMSSFSSSTNLSAAQMSYGSGYDPSGNDGAGARQQQQTVGFGSYNASMMMYSVPQTNAQTSMYSTSQYAASVSSRNNPMASTSLLSSQPDVNPAYFETAEVSPGTTSLDPATASASTTAYYQGIPATFHYAAGAAPGSSGDSASGISGLTGAESFYHLADPGVDSSAVMAETSAPDRTAEFEEKWKDYQRRLANVFQDITNGTLDRAADGLLGVSFWLLSRVEELGLTDDDEDLHKDRLKLWQDFNHAWIALIFKQKQYMLRELGDTIVLQPLSLRIVKRMGDELIRLCDGIERHGLVDYQFGVWEDEIESLLEDCVKLFEEREKESGRRDQAKRNG
ncbi:hypothetical protein LMH87_004605 [Akanthomyces muscarius]|uniref:Uncharacterized protein n=1 Tax=Akanthomyces muscarius TaxID=2231603 RepID=A0A9W8UI98_AKAMU|nr:hypothetical protein LMH87_004605 [Akanthomyces muscarius]KAJ4145769.1 hypothetical protein LMH87_004605 [Akanthomyces muscarius]